MLQLARTCVLASIHVSPPVLSSRLYATSPVDCPPGSEPFLNAVIEVGLVGEPEDLLRDLRHCEQALGRPSRALRHAPRGIDLDLLYAGDRQIETANLQLPHPRLAGRRFVLAPLSEINAGLVLPGQKRTVAELLSHLPPGETAEALDLPW